MKVQKYGLLGQPLTKRRPRRTFLRFGADGRRVVGLRLFGRGLALLGCGSAALTAFGACSVVRLVWLGAFWLRSIFGFRSFGCAGSFVRLACLLVARGVAGCVIL